MVLYEQGDIIQRAYLKIFKAILPFLYDTVSKYLVTQKLAKSWYAWYRKLIF